MSSKEELIITALQERIGQLVASYETQIAFLRSELTMLVSQQKEKDGAINNYNKELLEKMEEVSG